MKFWIDKENEKQPFDEWQNAYVFSINRKKYSTIFTNIWIDYLFLLYMKTCL